MTRTTKVNKRSVKKSTSVIDKSPSVEPVLPAPIFLRAKKKRKTSKK